MQPRIREVLDYLDAQREVLRAALNDVPIAERERRPAPDRWSAAEIIEHLAIVERRIARLMMMRIASAKAEGAAPETSSESVLAAMDLETVTVARVKIQAPETALPTGLKTDDAWTALERAGELVRDALRSADGLALGGMTHTHPALGTLSLYEWFAFVGAHEARHAAQIRESLAPTA